MASERVRVSKGEGEQERRGELITRRGELITRTGELITRRGELITRRGELITRRGELIMHTHLMLPWSPLQSDLTHREREREREGTWRFFRSSSE
jgi:hypothetical protein